MHRAYVKTSDQRKIFAMLRHYLPFLNMDVAYDNTRLMTDLGPMAPAVAPLPSYLGDLLAMIPLEAVLAEGSGS